MKKVMVIVDQPNGRFIGVHKNPRGGQTKIVGPTFDGFKTAAEARKVARQLGFEPVDCEW